ncbi:LPO_1073/Vpar_1526 family protein [Pseudarthrobacter sp. H2]|uniref:LPO_1073/Vpar_1526 family protein n=1 Tax=Pseudarthrobacter sp. H2 TaxID=3418415 RepID=UPI003CF96A8D
MKQQQEGGANSENYQAGGNILVNNNNGLSYHDVKQVTQDVMRADFTAFSAVALQTVNERFDYMSSEFSRRLSQLPPENQKSLEDPDVQYAISSAGKSYARRGTEELASVLLDLLTDRCTAPSESLLATVLNDAIEIAPRLTKTERATLAVAWRLLRTTSPVDTPEGCFRLLRHSVAPFIGELVKSDATYLHLQSLGCAAVETFNGTSLHDVFSTYYPVAFSAGLKPEDVPERLRPFLPDPMIFKACDHQPELLQVAPQNGTAIELLSQHLGGADVVQELQSLQKNNVLPEAMVRDMVIEAIPEFTRLYEVWDTLGSLKLSAVGIAIAHAVTVERLGSGPDLRIWINED